MMQLYGERFARASMLRYVEKIIFFFGGFMEIRHMFLWAIGAPLLLGTILSVATEAGGQKDTGSSSGGKQWLVAMDADHDGTVSKQEFLAYIWKPSSTGPTLIMTERLMQRNWDNCERI